VKSPAGDGELSQDHKERPKTEWDEAEKLYPGKTR
jgi:hypothetical protein